MAKWFQIWHREAAVEGTWEDVYSALEFSDVVSQDGTVREYEFLQDGKVFDCRFEWKVEPGDQSIKVTEKAYLSRFWFFAGFLLLLSCLAGFMAGIRVEGTVNLLLMVGAGLSFSGYPAVIYPAFDYRGPMADFFEDQPDQDIYQPFAFLIAAFFVPTLLLVSVEGDLQYVFLSTIIALHVVYVARVKQIEKVSPKYQKKYVNFLEQFPSIISDYASFLVIAALPMLLFVILFWEGTVLKVFEIFPYIVTLYFGVLIVGMLLLLRWGMTYGNRLAEKRFRDRGGDVSDRWVLVLPAVITVVTAAGFGYVSYLFVKVSQEFLSMVSVFPAGVIVLMAATPLVFILCGFVYQYWTFFSAYLKLVLRMRSQDLTDSYQTEVETYILDYDGYYAGSMSFLTYDFIVVSKGLVENLSDEQLDSVIAHEDCHIFEDEARNSVLVALFSPLLLIGKNVIYELFNFREREYRADRYAAQMTSPDHVVEALKMMQSLEADEHDTEFDAVTPTLTPVTLQPQQDESSLSRRNFEYFFGDFAATGAHPGLTDRISQVEREYQD